MVIGEKQNLLEEFQAFCELPENRDKLVEVKSPPESKRQMRLRAKAYIRFGTKIV